MGRTHRIAQARRIGQPVTRERLDAAVLDWFCEEGAVRSEASYRSGHEEYRFSGTKRDYRTLFPGEGEELSQLKVPLHARTSRILAAPLELRGSTHHLWYVPHGKDISWYTQITGNRYPIASQSGLLPIELAILPDIPEQRRPQQGLIDAHIIAEPHSHFSYLKDISIGNEPFLEYIGKESDPVKR